MDLHQLKTFVTVAREGSITRASQQLHLSQPAVSAHIKALEEALGLALFERNARGMRLTQHGQRLVARARHTLEAHQALLEEASRLKGRLTGQLRLGLGANSNDKGVGALLACLTQQHPALEVSAQHLHSQAVQEGLLSGQLDVGFYNEAGTPDPRLVTAAVSGFGVCLVAPPGWVDTGRALDWGALEQMPWICPPESSCCGRAAVELFARHQIQPQRILRVGSERLARLMVASEVGVGLLHSYTAGPAQAAGELEILEVAQGEVQTVVAYLASRAQDPLPQAVVAALASLTPG